MLRALAAATRAARCALPSAAPPRRPPVPVPSVGSLASLPPSPRRGLAARAAGGEAGGGAPPAPAPPRKTVEQIVKRISRADVDLQFARSGGAGGQNVNKVNTKVDARLDLAAPWLDDEVRAAVERLDKKRVNKDGQLVVTSTATRSQADNVEDALRKMQAVLDRAAESLIPPEIDPEKTKAIEKQVKRANENRLTGKKAKSDKKKERRAPIDW